MHKYPKGQEPDSLKQFLDAIEGFPMRHGLNVKQEHIYCDLCSQPIFPNSPATHYLSDKLLFDENTFPNKNVQMKADESFKVGDFYLLRIAHKNCESIKLPYPCKTYLEMFLEASWNKQFELQRPKILDISNRNEGVPWKPEKCYDSAMNVSNKTSEITLKKQFLLEPLALGPHDVITFLTAQGIDPRDVIHDTTGEPIAHKNTKSIKQGLKNGSDLMEKWKQQGPPPAWRFPRDEDAEKIEDERYEDIPNEDFSNEIDE